MGGEVEFDNTFEVPLPVAEAWALLLDIKRVAPCFPGGELTEVVDENTYKGKVSVRLGPVALTFAGTAKFEEKDAVARQSRVKAQGSDAKGRGGAAATVVFKLVPAAPDRTSVQIHTDLQLSGSVAQYGRGVGMIKDLAQQLIGQFATRLEKQLAESRPAAPTPAAASAAPAASPAASASPPRPAAPSPPPAPANKPISGFSLMLRVLWNSLRRLFGAA
jgi:carbon monoxide dehydrogenase subunit G